MPESILPSVTLFGLSSQILVETATHDRIVLWVAATAEDTAEIWQRITTRPKASIESEGGLRNVAVALLPFRYKRPSTSLLGKIFGVSKARPSNESWQTPSGLPVEEDGAKRTDARLVWANDGDHPVCDESQVKALWPAHDDCRRLGKNLFVVTGVSGEPSLFQRNKEKRLEERLTAREDHLDELWKPENNPGLQAEKMLAAARVRGSKKQEAAALTDLGVALLRNGHAQKAVDSFQEALAISRAIQDSVAEYDVLGNLGEGYLALNDVSQAMKVFNQVLDHSRNNGDKYSEKLMLHNLGAAQVRIGASKEAIEFFEAARNLAEGLGDRRNEAELSWSIAVCCEELGHREKAIEAGQRAVDIYVAAGSPHASVYAEHLKNFANGTAMLSATGPSEASDEGSMWMLGGPNEVFSSAGPSSTRPSLLRMVYTATRSMAKFIASGFKTVSQEANKQRLDVCNDCDHHTGVRCRLCGCFTAQKAWLPHEHCPAGKWPI